MNRAGVTCDFAGALPAHMVAYLTMALCLFTEDDYEEIDERTDRRGPGGEIPPALGDLRWPPSPPG